MRTVSDSISNQVAFIKITKNGSDQAVYLNGKYVVSADPGCGDQVEMIGVVAQSLANIFGVNIDFFNVEAEEDWSWDEIEGYLRLDGKA